MRCSRVGFWAMLLLAACGHTVQTTSGAAYLSRYPAGGSEPGQAASSAIPGAAEEALVRQAAAVEPILTFPARFGVARIQDGMLTAIPAPEAALWAGLAERHRDLGAFVPVNPLIADFTAEALLAQPAQPRSPSVSDIVRTIRLGSARQHVDAVLIYEVATATDNDGTVLGFANLTIVGGAFLPTRSIKARSIATALLLDVRNGYPYGSASTEADLKQLSTSWGSDLRARKMRERASQQAVEKLVPEIDKMIDALAATMGTTVATDG